MRTPVYSCVSKKLSVLDWNCCFFSASSFMCATITFVAFNISSLSSGALQLLLLLTHVWWRVFVCVWPRSNNRTNEKEICLYIVETWSRRQLIGLHLILAFYFIFILPSPPFDFISIGAVWMETLSRLVRFFFSLAVNAISTHISFWTLILKKKKTNSFYKIRVESANPPE